LDQWQWSQIFTIQEQQIKRDEHARSAPEKQIPEHRAAEVIEACNLAIDHCAFDAKMFSNPRCKIGEPAEHISVSRPVTSA